MFERSIDSEFDSSLMAVTERLLSITNRLLMFGGLQGEEFEDEDDLEDRWGDIVDVVDTLLERAVSLSLIFADSRTLVLMNFQGLRQRAKRR